MAFLARSVATVAIVALASCGTNTEEPVFPIFLLISPVAAPALVGVDAVLEDDGADGQRQFDVKYFVTNSESTFLGYNLYIASSATSAEAAVLGIGGEKYLETGIEPSFGHADTQAGTASEDLITQRVKNFSAPPEIRQFQFCELYFFRLTALVRGGLESNPSPEITACAALDPTNECPLGTACNPELKEE